MNNKTLFARLASLPALAFKQPYLLVTKIITKYPFNRMLPDKLHLSICYRGFTGQPMDWRKPKSFNEKLQWLKLHDRQDWYWKLADKVEARRHVAEIIGKEYLIPLIGIYSHVNDIDFEKLPDQFVLKCSHDSGSAIVCTDKSRWDIETAKAFLRKKMKQNFYYPYREYPYKTITPRILCETYLPSKGTIAPVDYKFLCFGGSPKLIQVDTGRFANHARIVMYPDWTQAPIQLGVHPNAGSLERPQLLDKMLELATRLSSGFRFMRVDFYISDNRIYFGELTFYKSSGFSTITPHEQCLLMGDWIDIEDMRSEQDRSLGVLKKVNSKA